MLQYVTYYYSNTDILIHITVYVSRLCCIYIENGLVTNTETESIYYMNRTFISV